MFASPREKGEVLLSVSYHTYVVSRQFSTSIVVLQTIFNLVKPRLVGCTTKRKQPEN